jgi:HPt (histidine-containing phosphotransfer) domain-containing protein
MCTVGTAEPVDWVAIRERFEGDEELLREVVKLFLDDCPRRLSELREAVGRGDREAIRHAAHSIKGSLANFAAAAAVQAALRLETMGCESDMTEAGKACKVLEQEVARLSAALAAMV